MPPMPPPSIGSRVNVGVRPKRPEAFKVVTVFVLIVVILYFGRDVLIPITLALLLTFLLAPVVNWFRHIHLGRVPSVVIVVTLALGALIGVGILIGAQLKELAADLPSYASTIEDKVQVIRTETLGRFSHVLNFNAPQSSTTPAIKATSQSFASTHQGSPTKVTGTVLGTVEAPPAAQPGPWELVQHYISPLLSPLATIGIVFVVAVFALLQREDLRDRLIRLIGPDDIHRTTLALDEAGTKLTHYFLTQLSINTVFGIVICAGMYFIGVPKPILWGILSTILRFIPYIGSFISALLPIALAAAIEPGWSMAGLTLAFYVVAEGITGQILEPLLYGQNSGISPFSVIVAAIFWSWVWGPVGLFLSTPLTLCLAVMGRHVRALEFIDVALGNRPPLTPIESFYQRILADDSDEVLEQAEMILKDMPLAQYFDQVALPGMQLAATDVNLGILSAEQQENVKTTIYELVAGLAEHGTKKQKILQVVDSNVPPGETDEAWEKNTERAHIVDKPVPLILSIAGRGPLDEPAASMLAHLLDQQGLRSRLVKYKDVSRYGVSMLDSADVTLVCIAYLNISGSPAHLRYLVQRLRRNLPSQTPILIGLWPQNEKLSDETKLIVGADYFVSSFKDVLIYCQSATLDGG